MPVKDHEDAKRTNEIKMAIPLLDTVDIEGKDITADALLTQRKIAGTSSGDSAPRTRD